MTRVTRLAGRLPTDQASTRLGTTELRRQGLDLDSVNHEQRATSTAGRSSGEDPAQDVDRAEAGLGVASADMPQIAVTWTITHERPLESGEDPFAPTTTDTEHLLWAVESGEVDVSAELLE